MTKKQEGFSYIEIVVSMAVFMLVSGMVYQSISVGAKLQRQASEKIEVVHQIEDIKVYLENALRSRPIPVGGQVGLLAYIATPVFQEGWLEKALMVEKYDYHVAVFEYTVESGMLDTSSLSDASYLSTTEKSISPLFDKLMEEKGVALTQQVVVSTEGLGGEKLTLQLESMESLKYTASRSIQIDGRWLDLRLVADTEYNIQYEMIATGGIEPIDAKRKRAHMPLIIEVDVRKLSGAANKKITFSNTTTFPVSIQVREGSATPPIQIEVMTTEANGHVTMKRYRKEQPVLKGYMVVVTKKGEEDWCILEKQMGMVATPF